MDKFKEINAVKNIALVAHDHKKEELINWINTNKEILVQHRLIATGTTGKMIEQQLNVPVARVLSGPLGGDQQLGAMIATGNIDMMIFFWDPMEAQPHDTDVKALLRLCVVWNIPLACCSSTADFIISSPYMNMIYKSTVADYNGYLKRPIN